MFLHVLGFDSSVLGFCFGLFVCLFVSRSLVLHELACGGLLMGNTDAS